LSAASPDYAACTTPRCRAWRTYGSSPSPPAVHYLRRCGVSRFSHMEFSACLGSSTPRGRASLAFSVCALLPSVLSDAVGSPEHPISELNTQPTDTPVQRSSAALRLPSHGRGPGWSYFFPVRLLHSLLLPVFPALSRPGGLSPRLHLVPSFGKTNGMGGSACPLLNRRIVAVPRPVAPPVTRYT